MTSTFTTPAHWIRVLLPTEPASTASKSSLPSLTRFYGTARYDTSAFTNLSGQTASVTRQWLRAKS
jgi:hypothetical protein